MLATRPRAKSQNRDVQQDLAATYDQFKEFEGKKCTGMKVGRSHKWYYDKGEWKETKITPDKWEFTYAVKKRRAGKAPEGSGVPVGTEYHWYILAHQNVRKLDANTYTTAMVGLKYKLAHMRAQKGTWSVSQRAQRKRLIRILEDMIAELRQGNEAPAMRIPEVDVSRDGSGPSGRIRSRRRPAARELAEAGGG